MSNNPEEPTPGGPSPLERSTPSFELFRRLQEDPENNRLWKEFHDYYHRRLSAWAKNKTGDAGVAEDLLQELFLKLWTKLGSLGERSRAYSSLRALINEIFNHLIQDWLRRQARRKETSFDEETCRVQWRDDLNQTLEDIEESERYTAAYCRFNADARTRPKPAHLWCYVLRFRHNLSVAEAAGRLGRPAEYVTKNTQRVRDRLAATSGLDPARLRYLDLLACQEPQLRERLERSTPDEHAALPDASDPE